MYQVVSYVDQENGLTEKEKYFYVKTLRAQLSAAEIAIFFLNSRSDFGKDWWVGEKTSLINKYSYVKNMPANYTFGIDEKLTELGLVFESQVIVKIGLIYAA